MRNRIGIHDVAAAAGVSTTTVSHAMNGRGKVSPITRERIQKLAADLGYQPNRIASALRSRRSGVLGLVSDEIATTPFAGRVILGAQDAAAEAGVTLMLVTSGRDAGVEQGQLRSLLAQQVDGVVYATMFHRRVAVPEALTGLPAVLLDAVDDGVELPSVMPDEYGTGLAATRLLLEAGHTCIAHLTVDERELAVEGRLAGYLDAIAQAGLRPHVVALPGSGDATAGRRAAEAAFASAPDTTAVFCFNDPMAMGAYQFAATRGLRIPDDLSVVGVDDLELISEQLLPPLTTFALPHYAMGRWAVQEVLRRVEEPDAPVERRVLPCLVVHRGSVAGPV